MALQIAGCSSQRHDASAAAPVPEINLQAALPAIAATYTTTRSESQHGSDTHHEHMTPAATPVTWRFYREANRVEIEDINSQSGELWQRDGNTQFFFKLFHADQRSIEYRMDDLQILEISASWQQHALLIEPALLQTLTLVEAGWRDGYPYRLLRGEARGEQIEVTWRVDLNLPQQIQRGDGEHSEVTTLQSVYPLAQSPWPRHDSTDYQIIDFADIGDHERDPFVQRIQQQLPGGDVHHH